MVGNYRNLPDKKNKRISINNACTTTEEGSF